jgi:ParB-like chromosome segregation protein Spo0J
MEVDNVAIESVDLTDQRFRISEGLDCAELENSLREVGQLTPVILLGTRESPGTVVCGFRRLRALRSIGERVVLVRSLSPGEYSPLQAFRIALWDNLAHRRFNALEKARILHTLQGAFGLTQDKLVEDYLPLLDLAPHQNVLRTYLHLHSLPPGLRMAVLDGRCTPASAERLCMRPQTDQAALAHVLERARWSSSLQRQVLDLVEEIAAVGNCSVADVLGSPKVTEVLEDFSLSPYQRGERIYRSLYQWRNPRLSRAQRAFLRAKDELGLPAAVRLTPPVFFETPLLRVEFEVSCAADFCEITAALHQAADNPALAKLFEVS